MDKERIKSQLATLQIPVFNVQWPEAIAPNECLIEDQMIKWGDDHGLFVNNFAYREQTKRARFASLAARCYPNARPELLQTIADFLLRVFLVDDLLFDRVDTITTHTLPNLTKIVNIMDGGSVGPEPIYGEDALYDICRRFRMLLSGEQFERFVQVFRMWPAMEGLQILNHIQGRQAGIEEYNVIRRYTTGVLPCIALSDAANQGSVTAEEFYDPRVQLLRRHTLNIISLANDIHSLHVETHQPGHFSNFIRGYMDWVAKDTQRYSVEFATTDADDRGILGN
ncbi:hypothetical protein FE257_002027 [Aspergillus nanangensis]|uniref:Terpene synthase n=1 Tax=Aspergillus nanangensis TaxID=2582783 RepID=A0AAD4CT72_ASPNN|nr:hypothetical protein FE257_002027 [Aspergillus nanangensis]